MAQIENFSNTQYKTDVSKEIIQYSRGTEQEVLSWTYPINSNHERVIEDSGLYTIYNYIE